MKKEYTLIVPSKVAQSVPWKDIISLMQKMINRLAVGNVRYGDVKIDKMYLSRLKTELKAYERTKNHEHLINIANYAILESFAPEGHFDGAIDSVTRKDFNI